MHACPVAFRHTDRMKKGDSDMKSRAGFTLVEIAILLVIITLLLGGILKGKEMVTQSKIKKVIEEFSKISAAYYGYQDRYQANPGDDPNAAKHWAGAASGNGDGKVEGAYNAECPSSAKVGAPESCLWWDDLRRAGFQVAGNGAKQPRNSFGGIIGVQTGNGSNGSALGGMTGLIVCSTNIPDKVAIEVDRRLDDGRIGSGTIRGEVQTKPNPDISSDAASTAYAESGGNTYTLCRLL